MILSFKPQFVEPILIGQKIHTIREDKHDRWEIGRSIEFATGVRTKNYNQFHSGFCLGVQRFEIWRFAHQARRWYKSSDTLPWEYDDPMVVVDGQFIPSWNLLLRLAIHDGFDDVHDFFNWFLPLAEQKSRENSNGNEVWVGKIIHWTAFKY